MIASTIHAERSDCASLTRPVFLAKRSLRGFWFMCLAIAFTAVVASQGGDPAAPSPSPAKFEGNDTLLRPEGYREWVFVGSSLGLRYESAVDDKATAPKHSAAAELYHNVYINPSSYRAYAQTGKFPEGTVMVLELAKAAVKREPGLQGSFQSEYVALEAAVKDGRRFPEGWAYFSFDGPDGTLKTAAKALPKEKCWSCHHTKAATDHVFTQFYPVLRAVRKE